MVSPKIVNETEYCVVLSIQSLAGPAFRCYAEKAVELARDK